jgi:hypothetical protein
MREKKKSFSLYTYAKLRRECNEIFAKLRVKKALRVEVTEE